MIIFNLMTTLGQAWFRSKLRRETFW